MQTQRTSRTDHGTITLYPYASLGHAQHGWLDARHHFSFGGYYDPDRLGFGTLLVINDDKVQAGKGFAPHPHNNMEIITYVRQGAITHEDSLGNKGRTQAGDVQVMSAGTGVRHSEYNLEQEETRLYQIWITPHTQGVAPRWEARQFPKALVSDALAVLVSGQEQHANTQALFIYQDAAIYGGNVLAGTTLNQNIKHQAYLLVSKGHVEVLGVDVHAGDGAEITGTHRIGLTALSDAEILIIDAPVKA